MKDCVFYKHRDLIKFEDFDNNDPATYLGFVSIHFMAMSILPNVYKYESLQVEYSRIELLQNRRFTLKILSVFINKILNTNITLDEKTFSFNIAFLNKTTPLNNEFVYEYLLPERYMSEGDTNIYITALQSYFPADCVSSTADIIPCSKYYELISD